MPIELRFGGYQGAASVHSRAGNVFGEKLADELGNSVKFTFDANIVERGRKASDLLSMVETGEIDGCYFSSSYLADRVPELGIFDQHFVVPDRARAYAILDGSLGRRLAALVESSTGYVVLDYWDVVHGDTKKEIAKIPWGADPSIVDPDQHRIRLEKLVVGL